MSKIIGQDKLIKEVNRIFQVFVNSNCKIRPHFILTGESGSGKSFTIKQLCDMNELSFLEVNAAQITKEGISGNSLSKILSPLVNYSHTPIVVFVDEFDKLFINGNTNSQLANESTASVQNEFLKLLESDTTSVFGDYGKYTATDQVSIEEEKEGCLETVFEDGILKKEYSLEEIRQRIDHGL